MGLLDGLLGQLGGSALSQMSKQIGADEDKTGKALSAVLPLLMSGMAKNASSPQGAEAISRAIEKDHDGGILDNLTDFLGKGGNQSAGAGILRHVLGSKQPRVEKAVSKSSGLDQGAVNKLMAMAAPMLMGQLGKQKKQQGLSSNAIAQLLSQEKEQISKRDAK